MWESGGRGERALPTHTPDSQREKNPEEGQKKSMEGFFSFSYVIMRTVKIFNLDPPI